MLQYNCVGGSKAKTLRNDPRPDFLFLSLLRPLIFPEGHRANKAPGTTAILRSQIIQVSGRCPVSIEIETKEESTLLTPWRGSSQNKGCRLLIISP